MKVVLAIGVLLLVVALAVLAILVDRNGLK
jgi:hypothetical protein